MRQRWRRKGSQQGGGWRSGTEQHDAELRRREAEESRSREAVNATRIQIHLGNPIGNLTPVGFSFFHVQRNAGQATARATAEAIMQYVIRQREKQQG